jgi:[acyl-carrier-protein] S-malonyltransferase
MNKKIAFVFPGQGSQTVGMLKELAAQFSAVIETFAEASSALGYDLWQLVQEGPVETLNQTAHTQPALLTASVAIWRVWQQQHDAQPIIMAGHSLGEYSALVCAQALNFADAVKLVAERGRFMQEAVPEGHGAMAAVVGLDDKQVQDICKNAAQNQILSPVNYNAIGQVVVAGETAAVDRAVELAKQAGAKMAKRLPVSVPSHCALMQPAADKLAVRLQNINLTAPKISVINNVDVATRENPTEIKDALVRQLYNPVRWVETVQFIAKQNVELIIECGPGKVLAGLNKRIVADIPTSCVNDPESLQLALEKK